MWPRAEKQSHGKHSHWIPPEDRLWTIPGCKAPHIDDKSWRKHRQRRKNAVQGSRGKADIRERRMELRSAGTDLGWIYHWLDLTSTKTIIGCNYHGVELTSAGSIIGWVYHRLDLTSAGSNIGWKKEGRRNHTKDIIPREPTLATIYHRRSHSGVGRRLTNKLINSAWWWLSTKVLKFHTVLSPQLTIDQTFRLVHCINTNTGIWNWAMEFFAKCKTQKNVNKRQTDKGKLDKSRHKS